MEELFDLRVTYRGTEHTFNAGLLVTGYTYKFHVLVEGQTIVFEPDEEGSYRAIVAPAAGTPYEREVDQELIALIIRKLESIRD